jgi:hypothetical protein
VAGSSGDRADVHAGCDELGDHEVPQVVQPAAHPETLGEFREPVGDAIGPDGLGAVGLMAEHVGVGRERHAGGESDLGLLDSVGAQQLQRGRADRDPALGVVLGPVLVDQRPAGDVDDAAVDQHLTVVEVHVSPAQAAQLAAARTEHDGQHQEQPQLGVLGGSRLDEPHRLSGLGGRHLRLGLGWWGRRPGRVVGSPAPYDGLLQGAGQHGVHVPDGAGGHGDALYAVRLVHALLAGEGEAEHLAWTHRRLAVAYASVAVLALAAALTQLGVEAVQGGRVEPADGQGAEGGLDLQVDAPPVVGRRSR